MSNHYADAIAVLADPQADFRAIVFEIAKSSPKAVVFAAKKMHGNKWLMQCGEMAVAGQKVEAIKLYREKTGSSLLEAKTAVERM